ncbi:HNH endonuclease [Desulfosediminicola ganghwensis]|uniref:HNH endonuclease n=1 Tax=Desulfosediminicola ganghwensis TaxID=2569540 RepID=UPI0010AD85C9|nr:HNH endonuclease [Desulfosediminicola ganghwensis]
MAEKTPYSRSPESTSREKTMRKKLAPELLSNLGKIISDRLVRGMHFIEVQPNSGPSLVIWVKCAWKPGKFGNCAVQLDFPGKDKRANTAKDTIRVVDEKAIRARERGATHLLMLAADNEGHKALAANIVPIEKITHLTKECLSIDESLTRNGASPSIYVVAHGERQTKIVNKVRRLSTDLLNIIEDTILFSDAIDDLVSYPIGSISPEKKVISSGSYSRDPAVRTYVLNKADGQCEYCGEVGFLLSDGVSRYLESHHIIALADAGQDTIGNVIALCPKHHREAHYGLKRNDLESQMLKIVKKRN